jgi:hypothetical protein
MPLRSATELMRKPICTLANIALPRMAAGYRERGFGKLGRLREMLALSGGCCACVLVAVLDSQRVVGVLDEVPFRGRRNAMVLFASPCELPQVPGPAVLGHGQQVRTDFGKMLFSSGKMLKEAVKLTKQSPQSSFPKAINAA